ncbi:MAG: hypothetical protein HYT62_02495 [Candidatus Yanofskybacteria bacterium]|nr:hypothetical protein [Candidatus Yanofskybacteria bacterium]
MSEWHRAWNEFRCLAAEIFLGLALSTYPKTSLRKIRLAQFLKDTLADTLREEWGLK